ncbi:MAG: glycosyltransferase family 4 protein [Victivallales bacterium]|nr:glycosyltransferase family 4 protein [Victivallales bacterium]
MNIALVHFRVGETDGVSLEMDKWKTALERLGHRVYMLAGSEGKSKAYVIPELHYKGKVNNKIIKNAYKKLEDYNSQLELKKEVREYAFRIQEKVEEFLIDYNIDVLVPNNIWSLGWGLPAAVGIYNAVKNRKVKCVAHNHDFYWERDKYSNPTCNCIQKMLDNFCPPEDPLIKNVTINNIAKRELKKRKGVDAEVVPNVFDFKAPLWKRDEYNQDFRENIGVEENDILILQATRITERKAIELAIDFTGELARPRNLEKLNSEGLYDERAFTEQSNIVFVMAGMAETQQGYIEKLNAKAASYNIKILYVNDVIEHSRCTVNGRKCYSLWDAYAHADFVTYPSILEGWGNQFLEAVFAKKPVLVYEYPVFVTDIKNKGFEIVSLGSRHTIDEKGLVKVEKGRIKNAAAKALKLLTDSQKRGKTVEHNFAVCDRYYSYERLEAILNKIFKG